MLATKKHLGPWGPLKHLLVLCIRFRILWKETGLECGEYFDLLQEYIVSENMAAVWIIHKHKYVYMIFYYPGVEGPKCLLNAPDENPLKKNNPWKRASRLGVAIWYQGISVINPCIFKLG